MFLNKRWLFGSVIVLFGVIAWWLALSSQHVVLQGSTTNDRSLVEQSHLPVVRFAVREKEMRIPILMYHHVGDLPANSDSIRTDLTVPIVVFEKEVRWLRDEGYHSISLNDYYLSTKGQFALPSKPIIFTFDDGYDDVFVNAIPVLEKYGFVGSFAIITTFPGTSLGTNTYATWGQIATAREQGMEIVSHTQNHFDGADPKYNKAHIYENLLGSAYDIEQPIGVFPHILIYPYGHFTSEYIEAAQQAGFVIGIVEHGPFGSLMKVPRIRVHGQENLETFEKILKEHEAAGQKAL